MTIKLSENRKTILKLIESSSTPISASEIYQSLEKQINLSTIYRALLFLEKKKLIEGFTIPCEKEGVLRYYYKKEDPHSHFFHCKECHSFSPFKQCAIEEEIKKFEHQTGNKVLFHTLYFTGICKKCLKAKE